MKTKMLTLEWKHSLMVGWMEELDVVSSGGMKGTTAEVEELMDISEGG